MSEDNRQRPHILRVLPAVNVRVRAYATRQGIAPNVAAEGLINGAAAEIAALDKQLVAARADLESAREATRRADAALESSHRSNRILAGRADAAEAEVARLTRELAGERLKTEAAQVRRSSAAPCACALPDDLAARVKARIAARPGRDFAFVVKNGCDRLEGSDGYQDRQKAARAAERA